MKKIITIIGIILLIAFTPSGGKQYNFTFNDAQLNALWNCIDNSNAPHSQVKQVQEMIQLQLKGQLPPIDSTKTKK